MGNNIEEIITTLYEMVQDAWSLPLGAEKCVLERDKVLDLLDEISNQLPGELKQAKTIVESRNEVITNAKREAESILKQAEADNLIKATQQKVKDLKAAASEYVDDALRRTEDSIANALNEIKASRSSFMALTGNQPKQPSPIIEDI